MTNLYKRDHYKMHVKRLAKSELLTPTISRTERDRLKIILLLNFTHQIMYNYTLRQHSPPSYKGEKKYIGRYCSDQSIRFT